MEGDSHKRTIDAAKSRRQMMRRSNVMAKQVISIRSALSLGFVTQLWVDTSSWVVMVVEVKPSLLSGDSERFLLKEITQVGDFILVEDEAVMEDDIKLVGLETLVGYTVKTPRRQIIGKVRGYSFNISAGTLESLELDSFGISIIPSSLVSTYALLVDDVLEVFPDTVIVRDAAVSRLQRLTKGFWDGQSAGKEFREQLDAGDVPEEYSERPRKSRKSCRNRRISADDLEKKKKFKKFTRQDKRANQDDGNSAPIFWLPPETASPKNQYATTTTIRNLAPEISFSNKENVPPLYSSAPVKKEINKEIDDDDDDDDDYALLANKLKTEKVLRERGVVLDLEMKEMVKRGEIQKQLELEVDRLYRLKEINLACMRVSRLRSLRDKEDEKKPHRQLNKAYICCTQGKQESFSSESV